MYLWILVALWIVFDLYWLVSSFFVKKSIKGKRSHLALRVLIIFLLLFLYFEIPQFHRFVTPETMSPVLKILGLFLTGFGLGIAIWARICLRSNWGIPMSIKRNPELITSGPYQLIRHPIYSGVLLAILGTALTSMVIFLLVLFIILGIYFVYSAQQEEKTLIQQFPIKYEEYKKKTRAMIPFIW